MQQSSNRTSTDLVDRRSDVKTVLSGLWIALLFVFAYVDIFGFWRADVIQGALDSTVPGVGFRIDQRFLTLTTLYVLIPSLMIVVSLLAPARANRRANLIVSGIYAITIAVSMIGESWVYYLLGSAVEIGILAVVARVAWSWPRSDVADAVLKG